MPGELVAAFPLSDTEVMLIASAPLDPSMADARRFSTKRGIEVRHARLDEARPERAVLTVEEMAPAPLTVDVVLIDDLHLADGQSVGEAVSPRFVHAVQEPMRLKVPQVEPAFPFPSTLADVHVSVMCCTGCNGGVHDRGLVALNGHVGGPWTGIWIQTDRGIEGPYRRWQRILCAGGVISEESGATTVVDRGWMTMQAAAEPPHHPPPPLRLSTLDLPLERTTSLISKSLDGVWVEFGEAAVETSERVGDKGGLPHTDIVITDASKGRTAVRLYQPTAAGLEAGMRLELLRGFVHAEEPGLYLVLSDKEEDLVVTSRGGSARAAGL
jgi:hypothetical protein